MTILIVSILTTLTHQLELVVFWILTFNCEGETEETAERHFAASIGVVVFNSEAGTEDIIKWAIT